MHSLLTITWDMGRGIPLGFFTLRYYSLLFALGFILGYLLMKKIFQKEGVPLEKLDTLLTYVVIATIVGARLGHVFFYQWDYYSQHPIEIFKVWEGGLASHGAAIAIIIAIIIYCRRELKKPTLWMLDRVVITIALAGALIRMGNWFNSEIYGDINNSALQTVYTNPTRERVLGAFGNIVESMDFHEINQSEITDSIIYPVYEMQFEILPDVGREKAEQVVGTEIPAYVNSFKKEDKNIIFSGKPDVKWSDKNPRIITVQALGVPRNPTQIYEAVGYFLIFLVLYRLYLNRNLAEKNGFIFGWFLILVWGFRFVIEYFKEVQVTSEVGKSLDIGQYLSIPLIIAGVYFIVAAKKPKPKHEQE